MVFLGGEGCFFVMASGLQVVLGACQVDWSFWVDVFCWSNAAVQWWGYNVVICRCSDAKLMKELSSGLEVDQLASVT